MSRTATIELRVRLEVPDDATDKELRESGEILKDYIYDLNESMTTGDPKIIDATYEFWFGQ